jgi:hypothetical protein
VPTTPSPTVRFYCDVVGADVLIPDATSVASPAFAGRAAILRLGGRVFDLCEHSRNGGERFDPAHTGLDHFALEARSPKSYMLGPIGLTTVESSGQRFGTLPVA